MSTTGTSAARPHRRALLVAALTTVVAIGLAACSSSGSKNAASSTGSTAPGSGSAVATGGASAEVAAAQAIVAKAEQTPTSIGDLPKLTRPVAKGKTLVFLQCELTQCKLFGDGMQAAAAALGWNLKRISYQNAEPQTLIAGFQQALTMNPVAVSESGTPIAEWQSIVPAYQKAGIPIIPIASGQLTLSKTILVGVQDNDNFSSAGKVIANWFIADSGGKGRALFLNVPTFDVLKAEGEGLTAAVSSGCSACHLTTLNATLNQVSTNGLVPAIVSALRKDRSLKYVLIADGVFVSGVPAALKAAGLSGIKIAGYAPSVENQQNVANGSESAWATISSKQAGWQVVDAAARYSIGMPVAPSDGVFNSQLLTKANIASIGQPAESIDLPNNYADLYKAVWLVS